MPSGRSSSHELLRLLGDLAVPLYLLDEQRRIVFANQAVAQWLGIPVSDLLGRPCRYQSGETEPLAWAADALCPPPEVFHGQKTTGVISRQTVEGRLEYRSVDFISLPAEGERWIGVLAIARAAVLKDGEIASSDFPASDGQHAALASESRHLHDLVRRFRQETVHWQHIDRLVGFSPAMTRVREQLKLAAVGTGTVLVFGSPGIGRQHAAGAIHAAADQHAASQTGVTNQHGALTPVACAVLPSELLRSTIAALGERCQRAAGTLRFTLLLTEVQRLAVDVQSDLMRWLDSIPPNLRVISTSVQPLETLAQQGEFRPDLAQRLSTLVIHLPPLTERREDIPLLAQMFLEDLNAQGGKQLRGFKSEAMDRLSLYDWPGQVDELVAAVRQAFAQAEGFEITCSDLPKQLHLAAEAARFPRQPPPAPIDLEQFLARVEAELIDRALRQAKGNKSHAARLLTMTRPRLYRRMVQLGLEPGGDESIHGDE
jgi:DNA-binding NtrC family response regulator